MFIVQISNASICKTCCDNHHSESEGLMFFTVDANWCENVRSLYNV